MHFFYDNIKIMQKLMKKILLLLTILTFGLSAFADDKQEVLNFFNNYIQASNNYSSSVLDMYSDDATIIRQVVKPNGELANAYFSIDDYRHQLRLSAKIAKIKHYKNYYSDISATKVANGYKISAMRKPSSSDYKLKTSMIIQKQSNGKWLITKEIMQTKEQIFLKYAK